MPDSPLIDGILEAGFDAGRWPELLRRLCEELSANAALYLAMDGELRDTLQVASWQFGPDERFVPEVALRYVPNPWSQAATGFAVAQPEIMSRHVPPAALHGTTFYERVVAVADIPYCLGATTVRDRDISAAVTLYRRERSGDFEDADLHRFAELVPALVLATRMNARVRRLEFAQQAACGALEDLRTGVFLLTAAGLVRFANAAARDLTSAADGIALEGARLRLASSGESDALDRALRRACTGDPDTRRRQVLRAHRPSGRQPLLLLLAPCRPSPSCPTVNENMATLYVTDPCHGAVSGETLIREAFELTSAEAAVTVAVATGRGAVAAAGELGISENTARTHLKRVFRKTDTRSQADLVRLLLAGLPPVRP